jgi:multidrug efflux pump
VELAPFYVNQFTYGGRVKRVYLQADAPYRMGLDAFDHVYTPTGVTSQASTGSASTAASFANGFVTPANSDPSNSGISPYNLVPLSGVVKCNCDLGPLVLTRYNGYASIEIVGSSATGYSTGHAIDTLQNIVNNDLPAGFAADWTGQSYQG